MSANNLTNLMVKMQDLIREFYDGNIVMTGNIVSFFNIS